MQVYVQKWTRITFPRKADADSGGELSHASARSRDARPDGLTAGVLPSPWKNAIGSPVGIDERGNLMSPTKPAIGAPIAMTRTAASRSLLTFIVQFPGFVLAVSQGINLASSRSGLPFSTTYVASSAALTLSGFVAERTVPYGMNRTSPASSVTGGLPSTSYSSVP